MQKEQSIFYFTSIIPSKNGGYMCTFKDFPEALTSGKDLEQAIEMAIDVLKCWAENYVPVGKKELPQSSSIKECISFTKDFINETVSEFPEEIDTSREVIYQLIKFPQLKRKPVRVNVSLTVGELEEIDAKAEKLGMTRSRLFLNGAFAYDPYGEYE